MPQRNLTQNDNYKWHPLVIQNYILYVQHPRDQNQYSLNFVHHHQLSEILCVLMAPGSLKGAGEHNFVYTKAEIGA